MFGISEFTVRWTGLFALAIAVIPVGVDAQRTQRTRAEAGDAEAQFNLGVRYDVGRRTMCWPICGTISRQPKEMKMRRDLKASSSGR